MEEGAVTLNRLPAAGGVVVACERCGFRTQYRVATLSAIYGPTARLADFLNAVRRESNCPYRDGNWVDRCSLSASELSEAGTGAGGG
jgi:hypothetical protein